jgi:hypothetical protein
MSDPSNYADALTYVRSYCRYKRRSEALGTRPMWFTGFPRYDDKYGTKEPEALVDLVFLMSQDADDQEAYRLYLKIKEGGQASSGGDAGATTNNDKIIRTRLRVLSSLQQTVRRQFMGADANPRTSLDDHRREYERKVTVHGMFTRLMNGFMELIK